MTYIIDNSYLRGPETPGYGDVIEADLKYRDHVRATALWADSGARGTLHYGLNLTGAATVTTTPDGDPISGTILSINHRDGFTRGRPDLGSSTRRYTYEAVLRGEGVEVEISVGLKNFQTGTVTVVHSGLRLSAGSTYPQTVSFAVEPGVDDVVLVWATSVEAPSGSGTLHSIEVQPARGGGAWIDRSSPVCGSYELSGADLPSWGSGSYVCAADRALDFEGWSDDSLTELATPTESVPGLEIGKWVWEGSGSVPEFQPTQGPSARVSAVNIPKDPMLASDDQGLVRLISGGSLSADPWVVLCGTQYLSGGGGPGVQGIISLRSVSPDVFSILIYEDAGFIYVRVGSASPVKTIATPAGWAEYGILVTYDQSQNTVVDFLFDDQRLRIANFSAYEAEFRCELGGGDLSTGASLWAAPYLVSAPIAQVGDPSEIMGYQESLLGWRRMLSQI